MIYFVYFKKISFNIVQQFLDTIFRPFLKVHNVFYKKFVVCFVCHHCTSSSTDMTKQTKEMIVVAFQGALLWGDYQCPVVVTWIFYCSIDRYKCNL